VQDYCSDGYRSWLEIIVESVYYFILIAQWLEIHSSPTQSFTQSESHERFIGRARLLASAICRVRIQLSISV